MDVLVVDEDPAFCKVVAHALKRDGHQVIAARDSLEALRLARDHPPALVLIDLMMTRINGLQLLLALKDDPATSGIPIIVWTTTTSEDVTRQALAFGADAMLIKTKFSMPELRRLILRIAGSGRADQDAAGMKRILVVEDDDSTREAVAKHLSGAGYAVVEAENGWEALLALDREKFDLILLDLVMPGMDGRTFLHILRNGPRHHDLPVLVVTAYDVEEMKKLVEPLGVSHVLGKKPPMWENLLPAVAAAVAA